MESFPNVISGLKKIFKAQIFLLIGNVLFYISGIILAVATMIALAATITDGLTLTENLAGSFMSDNIVLYVIMLIFLIVGLVFMVIGYINNIIGVKRAGKDEEGYNTAFWCIIFALIVTVVSVVLQAFLPVSSAADEIVNVVGQVMSVLGIIFIIQSTQVVLVKKNKEEYALKGNNVVLFTILPYVIAIIAKLISVFGVSATLNLIVSIISLICIVVGYILYLIFLKKSSNILAAQAEKEATAE